MNKVFYYAPLRTMITVTDTQEYITKTTIKRFAVRELTINTTNEIDATDIRFALERSIRDLLPKPWFGKRAKAQWIEDCKDHETEILKLIFDEEE